MNNTINLYLDELKPKKYYFTAVNTIYACIFVIICMVAIYAYVLDIVTKSKQDLEQVKLSLTTSQGILDAKQQALIKHNDKATFNNQKVQLEQKLKARMQLWNGVGKRLQTSNVDYYQVMDELTRHHSHELWLSEFSINDRAVVFHGFALNSRAVTQWMTYLQSSKSFKGREFSHIDIQDVDGDIVRFEIATSVELMSEPSVQEEPKLIGVQDVLQR